MGTDSSLSASKARLQQLRQGYRSQLKIISSPVTTAASSSPKRSVSPQRAVSPTSQRISAAELRKQKEAADWEGEILRQARLRAETQAEVKNMAREGQLSPTDPTLFINPNPEDPTDPIKS
jgi:hypothetical protein